jgi:coproporphyrinogen III oxidase
MDDDLWRDRQDRAFAWFRALRDDILHLAERLEDAAGGSPAGALPAGRFTRRRTERATADGTDGGGGEMAVLTGGRVLEKAGVNVSAVWGRLSPGAEAAMRDRAAPTGDGSFRASGISLVFHPRSPHLPAVHMNTRLFRTSAAAWFGGGIDISPALPDDGAVADFHARLAEACAPHGAALYPRFKAWADDYFFIPHRGEARGAGGIFFDDYATADWEADFAFIRDVGRLVRSAWAPLAEARLGRTWTGAERDRQLLRRGRYAEFNLVYDRGTKFGLQSGHDAEAVLMSLPPLAAWV